MKFDTEELKDNSEAFWKKVSNPATDAAIVTLILALIRDLPEGPVSPETAMDVISRQKALISMLDIERYAKTNIEDLPDSELEKSISEY